MSGFQTAAAISIALGQFKNIFGLGKDFTQSTHIDDLIGSCAPRCGCSCARRRAGRSRGSRGSRGSRARARSAVISLRDTVNIRATWTGWLWIGLLLGCKQLGGSRFAIRGVRPFAFLKITGTILICIVAIVATKLAEWHLSPGCRVYNEATGVSNVFYANSSAAQWNVSSAPRDNPHCIPMPKSVVGSQLPLPWPRDRALAITGAFGKPPTGNPHLRWALVDGKLLTGAIIITLVASLESIAIAKALNSKHRQADLDPNKEYVALGLANFFGAFTGGYPLSGSFSRSALNDSLGATSPVSVLTVAVIVGVVLKIASEVPLFYYLVRPCCAARWGCACRAADCVAHAASLACAQPQNALSAIVIVALTSLLDLDHFLWLARHDRKDAALWVTAFLAVLFQGVEIGILIAVVVSLGLVVVETILAPMPQLGLVPGSTRRAYRSMRQYPDAVRVPGVRVFRIEAPVIFANAPGVVSRLRRVVYGCDGGGDGADGDGDDGGGGCALDASGNAEPVRAVIVDMSNCPYVDSACACAALRACGRALIRPRPRASAHAQSSRVLRI